MKKNVKPMQMHKNGLPVMEGMPASCSGLLYIKLYNKYIIDILILCYVFKLFRKEGKIKCNLKYSSYLLCFLSFGLQSTKQEFLRFCQLRVCVRACVYS